MVLVSFLRWMNNVCALWPFHQEKIKFDTNCSGDTFFYNVSCNIKWTNNIFWSSWDCNHLTFDQQYFYFQSQLIFCYFFMAEKTLYLFLTFSVNFVMWRALDKWTISELKVLLIYIFHHSMCWGFIFMVTFFSSMGLTLL